MASAKDSFESATFLAGTFACGTWRGIGVAVGAPTVPGIEWTAGADRLHWTADGQRMHWTPARGVATKWTDAGGRMHYKAGRDRLHWEQGEE